MRICLQIAVGLLILGLASGISIISSDNTYDTINGTNYKFDLFVDPSNTYFGGTTNCYSNAYDPTQVLRSDSEGRCYLPRLWGASDVATLGEEGGNYRIKEEHGPFRVVESFYAASETVKLTYYMYDEYFLVRLVTNSYTGDYNDGAASSIYINDLGSRGPDSFGLHYLTGSKQSTPIDTWASSTDTTYDPFDIGSEYAWVSWYGNSSSDLAVGAIYPPLIFEPSSQISEVSDDEAAAQLVYESISSGGKNTDAITNIDIILGIYYYSAGNSDAEAKSILEAYKYPATPSCISNCEYAKFNDKEFIYEVEPESTDITQLKFKVTGDGSWNHQHKLYFEVFDMHTVDVYVSSDGSSWTKLYSSDEVQNDDNHVIFSDTLSAGEVKYYKLMKVPSDSIPSKVIANIDPLPFLNLGDNVTITAKILDEHNDIVNNTDVNAYITGPNSTSTQLSFNDTTLVYTGTLQTTNWKEGVFKTTVYAAKSVDANYTSQNCNDYWGFDCGFGPPETGDNTFDSCPTGTGDDESVEGIWINGTIFRPDDTVEVTCEFDTYDTANDQEYIWYYNGTGWRKLWEGDVGSNVVANKTITFQPDNITGTHWIRCIIDYSPEGDYCADSGSYYDNDDLSFKVYPSTVNISNTTYFHLYPGEGVSVYKMEWDGENKTFLENKHIVGAIGEDRELVYEAFQKDSATSYSFRELSLPQIARLSISSEGGLGKTNGVSAVTGENLTYGKVNVSASVIEPKVKKVCFVCYSAGSPDSTYETPYIQALQDLGFQVDYNVAGCNYDYTDIRDGTADFSGYDFWAHSWIYSDNLDMTNAKTKYVDTLGQSELILGPDATYLGDFGYATENDKVYYPSAYGYIVSVGDFLPPEDYSTRALVKLTDTTSGRMQYESHEDSLISNVDPIIKISSPDAIYVSAGKYENSTSGGKMIFFGIAEDAVSQLTDYGDGKDNGEEILNYFTKWVGGTETNFDLSIKLRDDDDDYFVFNMTNFSSDISDYEDLIAMFSGRLGSSYEDDRIHLENGSDWLISSLPDKTWVSTAGNYTAFYDNGTNDALTNITIGLVAYPSSNPAGLYAWFEDEKGGQEGGMINYSSSLANNDWLNFFFAFTLGNLSIDRWITTVENGDFPNPNFMTLPAISWNQSSLTLGPVSAGSSDSKNVTLITKGWHSNVNISVVSGNATAGGGYFITANPNFFTLAHGNLSINISCNPPGGQADGYYEVVFNARSDNNPIGDNITVGCQVGAAIGALSWSQSSLDLGSVYQAYSANETVNLVPSGENTNVVIQMLSGNGSFIEPNVTGFSSLSSTTPIRFQCKPYPWTEPGNYTAVWNARSDQAPDGDNITVSCEVKRGKQIVVVYTDGTWDIYPFSLDSWLTSADDQASFAYSCGSTGTAYVHYYNITTDPSKIVDKVVFSDNSTELNQITAITLEKTPGTY